MAEEKLNLMEIAIMDAVRKNMNQEGVVERTDIGKHCRTIVSDYEASGPTLWTEATTRKYADTLDGLIEKGYLAWRTYILQIELTKKGKQFITDNEAALDSLPQVDDSRDWFKNQPPRMSL
jgi:hypothetical protein